MLILTGRYRIEVGIKVHQSLDCHSLFYCLCSSLNKYPLEPKLLPTLDEDPCFLYYPLRHFCYYPLWYLCSCSDDIWNCVRSATFANIYCSFMLQIWRHSILLYFKRCIGVLEGSAYSTVALCLKTPTGLETSFYLKGSTIPS